MRYPSGSENDLSKPAAPSTGGAVAVASSPVRGRPLSPAGIARFVTIVSGNPFACTTSAYNWYAPAGMLGKFNRNTPVSMSSG